MIELLCWIHFLDFVCSPCRIVLLFNHRRKCLNICHAGCLIYHGKMFDFLCDEVDRWLWIGNQNFIVVFKPCEKCIPSEKYFISFMLLVIGSF